MSAGFKNIENLYGGIFEWVNQGKLVQDSSGYTNNVHPYNKDWGKWLLAGEKKY